MRVGGVLVASLLGVALVVTYVALGGTSYHPSPVADPCAPREAAPASTTDEQLQLVVLAAADETACGLGVSREELVLSLRSVDELQALAEREGVSRDRLEESLRDGLGHAVDTAEDEGLLGERTSGALGFAAQRLPLGLLLALLRGATGFLDL
jgi:hypothetical protein